MTLLLFCKEVHLYPLFLDSTYKQYRASQVAQLVKNLPAKQETQFNSWVGKFPWRRNRLPTPVFLGFPGGSDGEETACNAGCLASILGWEDPLEEGMATHSRILDREPGGLQSMGSQQSDTTE